MNDDTPVLVALARLEGKLDANIASHAAAIDGLQADKGDQETRIRRLESRATISPGQLWTGLIGVLTAAVSVTTIARAWFPGI